MRPYEIMFILDDRKLDAGGKTFIEKTTGLIKDLGGAVMDSTMSRRQQLAYTVRRRHSGCFLNMISALPPEKINDFKAHFRLNNAVLRLEVYSYAPPKKRAKKQQVEAAATA